MEFLLIISMSIFDIPDQSLKNTHYIIKDLKNNNMEIIIIYLKNDNILVKSTDNKYKEVLTVDEFVKKYNIPLKVVGNTMFIYVYTIFLLMIILMNILVLIFCLNMIRREYYIKILQDIK